MDTLLGANSVATTITWAYMNAADRVLSESTFTYQLYNGPDGWKILLQATHDASSLLNPRMTPE